MPAKEDLMSLTRRSFVKTAGLSSAALLALQKGAFAQGPAPAPGAPALPPPRLLLHNNENPLGPGEAVLNAVKTALKDGGPAGRYPFKDADSAFKAIADRFGCKPENVVMGSGSTQILTSAVQMFTSTSRPLVSGIPSYEEAMDYAERIGTPVRAIPLDANMKLDLNAMADASKGAGLVFVNNPNNPTATLWGGDAIAAFIDKVLKNSPDALILLDEAYHDYVTDPSHHTQIPLALKNPRVVVARTFSKAHGMAGMRIGYGIGHADTIKKINAWEGGSFLNVPGLAAATASIKDQARLDTERARNTEARKYTIDWFKERGLESTDSQCNFIFVNVKRPAREFRDACRKEGVLIARDFPPYEKSHVRISIGTLEEMKSATETFARALAAAPAKAA
jgi:histidinol-phosphate aminotransferase